MRRRAVLGVAATAIVTTLATSASALPGHATTSASPAPAAVTHPMPVAASPDGRYVVLLKAGADVTAAAAHLKASGVTVEKSFPKLGFLVVHSASPDAVGKSAASSALIGVAPDIAIGHAPIQQRARSEDIERLTAERAAVKQLAAPATAAPAAAPAAAVAPDPLSYLQWDMRQIGATANGSYAVNKGGHGVIVGVIDTGVDGSHPDVAANFDKRLSANFVTDMPSIDGPCEHPTCIDPVDEDDNGHGTHVASTIGAPINGIGIAGVAPDVRLVNIRAGQDSGYFFLISTVEALVYAGDIGADVVNMSFYTDPWLYNCVHNPADSPAEQLQQQIARELTQRAVNYARNHGVLPVAAAGNEFTDLGHPTFDPTSPDYPAGAAKNRHVTDACITVPTETNGVTVVTSTGPSTRLAYYSNYGTEQTDVSAPGGDYYDSPELHGNVANLVLAAMPKNVAKAEGVLNPNGTPNTPFVIRNCEKGTCAYYQYLQGTSMATPHAVGVAALLVAARGHRDSAHPGLTLAPDTTRRLLLNTAVPHACPSPRTFQWNWIRGDGSKGSESATCRGGVSFNGFYGHGIVNAYNAVTSGS